MAAAGIRWENIMGNNVKRETAATITAAIDRAIKSESALSTATVDRFADYVDGTDAIVARMAYVVRLRGIDGAGDGNASLQKFADRTGRKRASMSQYATMVGWLVESHTEVTAVTFGAARTLYGRGKDVRKVVTDNLAAIADLDSDAARVNAWQAMLDATKPTKSQTDDVDDNGSGEDTDDTRGPGEVNVPTPTMTRQEWIDTLDALATSAVLLSDATESERAHVNDALAAIAALNVPATIDA